MCSTWRLVLLFSLFSRCQVAAEAMPLQSTIIGVDLVAIKPIRGVVTFQEDITTKKCINTIKKELNGKEV